MTVVSVPAAVDPSALTVAALGVEIGAKYTIVGPDATVAVLNDPVDPYNVGYLSDVSGLDSAEVRDNVDLRTAADGAIHGNFYYGRRIVVLSGYIGSDDAAIRNTQISRLQRATAAMTGDLLLRWQTVGGVPVELSMRRSEPLRISERIPKKFQVGLAAADPRIYSQSYSTFQVGGGSGTSAKQASSLVVNPRVRTGWDAQMIVQTLGTSPTPPLVTLVGPLNAWEVYNATTNTSIKAVTGSTSNIPSGSTLTINYADASAELQTGATVTSWYNRIDFVNSQWTPLAAGPNDLRLFGTGASSSTTSYRVDWREAWY